MAVSLLSPESCQVHQDCRNTQHRQQSVSCCHAGGALVRGTTPAVQGSDHPLAEHCYTGQEFPGH